MITISADSLPALIEQEGTQDVTPRDLNHWMNSKYEPLLTTVGWGTDMLWTESGWSKYGKYEDIDSEANTYRINSYRVLLTRGRDGLIVFVPDEDEFNATYEAPMRAGLKELQ